MSGLISDVSNKAFDNSNFDNLVNNDNADVLEPAKLTVEDKLKEALDKFAKKSNKPTTFSTFTKVMVGIFTVGIGAGVLAGIEHFSKSECRKAANATIALRNRINSFNKNPEARPICFKRDNFSLRIAKNIDGKLDVKINGEKLECSGKLDDIRDILDMDIVKHPNFYGKDNASLVIRYREAAIDEVKQASVEDYPHKDAIISKNQAILDNMNKIVLGNLGLTENELNNISSHTLTMTSQQFLDGQIKDVDSVRNLFQKISSTKVNSDDALELLDALAHTEKNVVDAKISINSKNLSTSTNVHATDEEKKVHNFVSDIIYSEDTWENDSKNMLERMQSVLDKHADTFKTILADKSKLNTIDPSSKTVVIKIIDELSDILKLNQNSTVDEIKGAFNNLSQEASNRLVDLDEKISGWTNEIAEEMQTKMVKIFDHMCAQQMDKVNQEKAKNVPNNINNNIVEDPKDLLILEGNNRNNQLLNQLDGVDNEENQINTNVNNNSKISDQERIKSSSLEQLVKANNADIHNPGIAKFMHEILGQYFVHMPKNDKRSMFSALIRYSNSDPKLGDGIKLGAMLKGAGPLLQKMMQSYEGSDLPKEFRDMLTDLKSNLAPIPETVIKASLLKLVDSSNGEVTHINVKKSLGAATIGQAFLCDLTLKDGTTKKCVVKLLRTDIQKREQAEELLFKQIASNIPGMLATYNSRIESIKNEMDLSIEYENIAGSEHSEVCGKVYNNTHLNNVSSIDVVKEVPKQRGAIVLEFAPGNTLDDFERNFKSNLDEITSKFKTVDPLTNKVTYSKPKTFNEYQEITKNLGQLYKEVLPYQKMMVNASEIWLTESLYGSGFFHGDLHPGNIMVDGKQLHIIDFGNSTKMTKDERTEIMRICAAAAAGHSEIFIKGIKNLLNCFKGNNDLEEKENEASKQNLANKEQELKSALDEILNKGNAKTDTGLRMMAAFSEMQRMGLKVPDVIFKFNEAMVRLQSGLETINYFMKEIENSLSALSHVFEQKDSDEPINLDQEDPSDTTKGFETLESLYHKCTSQKMFFNNVSTLNESEYGAQDLLTKYFDQVSDLVNKAPVPQTNIQSAFETIGKYFDPSNPLRCNLPGNRVPDLQRFLRNLVGSNSIRFASIVLELDKNSTKEDVVNARSNLEDENKKKMVDFLLKMSEFDNHNPEEFYNRFIDEKILSENFSLIQSIVNLEKEPDSLRICFEELKPYFNGSKAIPAKCLPADPNYENYSNFVTNLTEFELALSNAYISGAASHFIDNRGEALQIEPTRNFFELLSDVIDDNTFSTLWMLGSDSYALKTSLADQLS